MWRRLVRRATLQVGVAEPTDVVAVGVARRVGGGGDGERGDTERREADDRAARDMLALLLHGSSFVVDRRGAGGRGGQHVAHLGTRLPRTLSFSCRNVAALAILWAGGSYLPLRKRRGD
jgi:hypothetical protein